MDEFTNDAPQADRAYHVRWYQPDPESGTGISLHVEPLAVPTKGVWAAAIARNRTLERSTSSKRVDLANWPSNNYVDVDKVPALPDQQGSAP